MADTYNYPAPKPQFDVGRVINRTFGAIKNNFLSFFLTSLVIVGIPTFIAGLLPISVGSGGIGAQSFLVMTLISYLFLLVGSILLQGALIFGAVSDFNGRKAEFGECMSIALRHFFPLLGMAILIFLGVFFGFIFFIIPGLIIALGWVIAAPVLIVEKRGVMDSISRSWGLTSGYKRWILLLAFIYFVISFIIGAIVTVFAVIAGEPATGSSTMFIVFNALFSGLLQALTTMINAAGVAAIYFELRQIREGIGAENLAAVFD